MIFRAKLKLNDELNAQELLLAFFKEFDLRSSIKIEGGEAQVEIVFDTPPMEIVGAVGKYGVIKFEYSQNLEEPSDFEKIEQHAEAEKATSKQFEPVEAEDVTPKQPESVEAEEVIPEQLETAEAEDAIPERFESAETEEAIPRLAEIAKKSSSYDEFVKAVIAWLEFGFAKREEFFEQVIEAASQAEKITWENIKKIIQSKGVAVSEYVKIKVSQQITSKFENTVTMMKLIRAIVAYKEFEFQGGNVQGSVIESNEETSEEATTEPKLCTKQMSKMNCMPEIPSFEEALGNVDRTQPIEERVRYVLTAMGLEKEDPSAQQRILEIANTAVRTENVEDTIFAESEDMEMVARLTFSTFINDFLKRHGVTQNVKVFDFLRELKRIVT